MMITTQPFGRTGHMSTRIIFGGWALAEVTQEEADRTLELLLEYGINHIDTAASYGDSELRIGPWMDRYRQNFFLATKTGERTYEKAREQIRLSLERLRVDQIDMLQFHYLVDPDEWETVMGPGGALEAAVEAREAGLIRFIGVTGHDVSVAKMHLRSLERFDFDSVLLPYNYLMMQNTEYAADFERLLNVCQERNVAVQTIKSVARQPGWGNHTQTHHTWYRPVEDQAAIDRAVHWVLARPGIFLNTPGDIYLLPSVLEASNRFEAAPSDQEMAADAARLDMEPIFS
jgi:aryl-alcohol dehydrogenase-like predicted oxidoreductase